MKKYLGGIFAIIICLLVVTGCSKSQNIESNTVPSKTEKKDIVTIGSEQFELNSSDNLYDMHYKENYVDFHTDRVGNTKIMNYNSNDEFVFEVRMMYDDSRSDSELKAIIETQTGAKEQSKEINGIKYIYYEYTSDDGDTVHHYMYIHNGKAYSIGIFLGKNPGNIESVFMNNVSFE